MDRLEKIRNLEELQQAITKKKELISMHENQLKLLEEKYKQESISELPILLFSVDITLPMPDDESDYDYCYFYYFPDFDNIKVLIGNYEKKLLPNTIDLRESFKNIKIPERVWPENPFIEYTNETQIGLDVIKAIIDSILNNNSINSWTELKEYILLNIDIINEKIKELISHMKSNKKQRTINQLKIYEELANQENIKEYNHDFDIFLQRHHESRILTKKEIKTLKALCAIFIKMELGEKLVLGIEKSFCSTCIFKTNDNKWIVWETDEIRGFVSAKQFDNVYDACIECIKMNVDINIDTTINEFNVELNRQITDIELFDFANKMNYVDDNEEMLSKISTYSPGDEKGFVALLENFHYDPEQKEKVLAKYKSLKDKYIK